MLQTHKLSSLAFFLRKWVKLNFGTISSWSSWTRSTRNGTSGTRSSQPWFSQRGFSYAFLMHMLFPYFFQTTNFWPRAGFVSATYLPALKKVRKIFSVQKRQIVSFCLSDVGIKPRCRDRRLQEYGRLLCNGCSNANLLNDGLGFRGQFH